MGKKPTGPLARGAVHEDIEGVLAVSFTPGVEEPTESRIAACEFGLPDVRGGEIA